MGESVRDGLEENGKGKTRATPTGEKAACMLRGSGLVSQIPVQFNHSVILIYNFY